MSVGHGLHEKTLTEKSVAKNKQFNVTIVTRKNALPTQEDQKITMHDCLYQNIILL